MKALLRGVLFGVIAAATLPGAAQAQRTCTLCGSQVGTNEIDKAIGETAQALGLVRAVALHIGQVNNYEYVGAGAMVDLEAPTLGELRPVSRYSFNMHQQLWASRFDFEGPNLPRTIRVAKGTRAWDESWYEEKTKAGAIRKLKTAPADAVAKLRADLMWFQPHAFISHVAFAAAKKCLTPEVKACETKWTKGEEGGRAFFTVDINGQPFKGFVDANKRIASVEAKITLPSGGGPKTLVAKYTGWRTGESDNKDTKNLAAMGDNSLDKFHNGTFWPEFVVFELDGKKVLDLKITEGWGNPYTVFPDPELIAKAQ